MVVIIVIILFLILFYFMNYSYKRTNRFNLRFGQVEKYINVPKNIEIANLGSNHALYGFNYDGLDLNAFNFALSPQYLFYDLQILKAYSQFFKKNAVVIITIPAAVFCTDGIGLYDEKYYYFLPSKHIKNYSWIKKIKTFLPLLSDPKGIISLLNENNVKPAPEKTNAHDEAVVRRDGWVCQFGLNDMVSNIVPTAILLEFNKTTAIVSEMIDFCLGRGLRPVFVVPPVSKALMDLLGNDFLKIALYDNIVRSNKAAVPVFDYWGDEQFLDCSLYRNADFLTKEGSRIFTDRVICDLQTIGYLPGK